LSAPSHVRNPKLSLDKLDSDSDFDFRIPAVEEELDEEELAVP
jgi:hypothetical protein